MNALQSPLFSKLFVKPPLIPLLVLATFVDGFWTTGNMRTLASAVSTDGIIVVGMTIVMIAGGFDLSVGAVMASSGGTPTRTVVSVEQVAPSSSVTVRVMSYTPGGSVEAPRAALDNTNLPC